jgi:hypothetical protein
LNGGQFLRVEFLIVRHWIFPFLLAMAHLGTCPIERLPLKHRFRRGPTQPPLLEYPLKKNNPPEACNSRGRLFLRATLPGARREWLSEPVMASAFRQHITAPLL